jgi:predicted neuraminidase
MRSAILALGLFLIAQVAQATWTASQRITWTGGASEWSAMAVDSSGYLHVVWCDTDPGNDEIYHKKSTDSGATWTTSQRLTWTAGASLSPSMAVDSLGNLHVVWCDNTPGQYEIYGKKSTDGGATWTTAERLTWSPVESFAPEIARDPSGNLHLVWWEGTTGNYEIYYRKSTDEGATWGGRQRLTWSGYDSSMPALVAAASGRIHVAWFSGTITNYEIYYKRSTDGGATWGTSERLTWSEGLSILPAMAVDSSSNLYLVWCDNMSGTAEIFGKKSTDGGATWTDIKRLTWTPGSSEWPLVACHPSGNLYVFWTDLTPGNREIYYKMSTNAGDTWTTSQRLTWTSGDSLRPAVTVDASGNFHLVWEDSTPGNLEIYYKRGN